MANIYTIVNMVYIVNIICQPASLTTSQPANQQLYHPANKATYQPANMLTCEPTSYMVNMVIMST